MGVVVFNKTDFTGQYPEFSGINPDSLQSNFDLATCFLNNTNSSLVTDLTVRTKLLYLLTAHLTYLFNGTNDGTNITPPNQFVGRVASAAEGTVNAQLQYANSVGQSMAFFIQTKYGAAYWQLTAPFRSFRYVSPNCNPIFPFAGGR